MSLPSRGAGIRQVVVVGGGPVGVSGGEGVGRVGVVGGRVVGLDGDDVVVLVDVEMVVVEGASEGVDVEELGVVALDVAGVDVVVVPGSGVPEQAVSATAIARTLRLLRPFTVPPGLGGPPTPSSHPVRSAVGGVGAGHRAPNGSPRQDEMTRSRSATSPVATSAKEVDRGDSPMRMPSGRR